MSDSSSGGTRVSRRNILRGVSLLSFSAGTAWLLNPKQPAEEPSPGNQWCPSQSEMEQMSWIRGEFATLEKTIEPGGEFVSTLELENRGGEPGTYDASLDVYDPDQDLYVASIGVDLDVPAHGSTTRDVSVSVPQSFTGGRLVAPRLNSSCDLISPAIQLLEVEPPTNLRSD